MSPPPPIHIHTTTQPRNASKDHCCNTVCLVPSANALSFCEKSSHHDSPAMKSRMTPSRPNSCTHARCLLQYVGPITNDYLIQIFVQVPEDLPTVFRVLKVKEMPYAHVIRNVLLDWTSAERLLLVKVGFTPPPHTHTHPPSHPSLCPINPLHQTDAGLFHESLNSCTWSEGAR